MCVYVFLPLFLRYSPHFAWQHFRFSFCFFFFLVLLPYFLAQFKGSVRVCHCICVYERERKRASEWNKTLLCSLSICMFFFSSMFVSFFLIIFIVLMPFVKTRNAILATNVMKFYNSTTTATATTTTTIFIIIFAKKKWPEK